MKTLKRFIYYNATSYFTVLNLDKKVKFESLCFYFFFLGMLVISGAGCAQEGVGDITPNNLQSSRPSKQSSLISSSKSEEEPKSSSEASKDNNEQNNKASQSPPSQEPKEEVVLPIDIRTEWLTSDTLQKLKALVNRASKQKTPLAKGDPKAIEEAQRDDAKKLQIVKKELQDIERIEKILEDYKELNRAAQMKSAERLRYEPYKKHLKANNQVGAFEDHLLHEIRNLRTRIKNETNFGEGIMGMERSPIMNAYLDKVGEVYQALRALANSLG